MTFEFSSFHLSTPFLVPYSKIYSEAKRSETRIGEILAHVVTYPIVKLFPTAISVPIGLVAKAMAAVAEKSQELQSDQQAPLKTIYDNKQIHQIAQGEIDPI